MAMLVLLLLRDCDAMNVIIVCFWNKFPFFSYSENVRFRNCRKDLPDDAIHSEQMLAMLYCMAILR